MSNTVSVSIVVPIYNVEKYLAECIDSILSQTLSDWELILVNDGSPDNCEQICLDYVNKDNRITYIKQKNEGVSVARNTGFKKACGEYVFFMDSDDTIDKKFLETSYNATIKDQSDIVVIGEYFLRRPIEHISALPIMAFMVKNTFLRKYPEIQFPIGLQPCEDGLFTHRLLALTDKISGNQDGKYIYRQYPEQNHCSINKNCQKIVEAIPQWFSILNDFYDKYNLWSSKAGHYARFVEHEPWKMRLLKMPFNHQQGRVVARLIRNQMKHKILLHLSKEEYNNLSWNFRWLLCYSNVAVIKIIEIVLIFAQQCEKKIKKFLINLIPVNKIRKKLRQRYL